MFCNFISEDIKKFPSQPLSKAVVLPYPSFSDYCKVSTDHSFDKISGSINTNLIESMRYAELEHDKFPFSQTIETLPPEMPDLHPMDSMDTELIESDDSFEKDFPRLSALKRNILPTDDEEIPSFDELIPPKSAYTIIMPSIPCLQTVESLEKMCEEEGLKFNAYHGSGSVNDGVSGKAFEVDLICGHKIEWGETYYFIKWKNYQMESNTWEPSWHLDGCKEMIEFYNSICIRRSKHTVTQSLVIYFVRDLTSRKPYDILTMTKVCALLSGSTEKYVRTLKLTLTDMKSKVKQLLTFSEKKIKNIEEKLFQLMKYGEERKKVLINLKEWELTINAEIPGAYVTVENDRDLEMAPSEFIFIHDYINTVTLCPSEIVTFCRCKEDCMKEKNTCCPNNSEAMFAYNRHKKLVLEPGYPIFECNDKCSCPKTCINRVVQHGQKVKVAIFRTPGKGWGLKTLETIEKGQFVLEYLGEIITSEVAEERGRKYDYVARSYLFDLDYGIDTSCCYTVDAGHVGNVAHFINHSCDPNLHVFAVWINEQDPRLPRLAFFAKRKVLKGEELTFDYKMSKDHSGAENSPGKDARILCRCHSRNCRKYLF